METKTFDFRSFCKDCGLLLFGDSAVEEGTMKGWDEIIHRNGIGDYTITYGWIRLYIGDFCLSCASDRGLVPGPWKFTAEE